MTNKKSNVFLSPAPPESVLCLRGFGVAFGERVILSEVDLTIGERGVVVLMGPCGTGKSTLLRTLAGFNAANPSMRTWGEVLYRGMPLDGNDLPELVAQSARLMMASVFENIVSGLPERNQLTHTQQRDLAQRLIARAQLHELLDEFDNPVVSLPLALQRHLAIMRATVANPPLLCIDEPTTGLSDDESDRLLDFLRREAAHRALLVVLHNQQQARSLGGEGALLAGGRIQEQQPISLLFDNPRSTTTSDFVKRGTCAVPSPDARPEDLDDATPPPPPLPEAAQTYVSHSFGPRGFLWVKKGLLAGTPMPGVFFEIDYDLKALQRVGVTTLISLIETPLDEAPLKAYGLTAIWEPIPDMGAPSIEQGFRLCEQIAKLIASGEVVAVHCRAGLGRTGTILASFLIFEGASALEALDTARRIEPRWVQSEEQVAYLEEFASATANRASGIPNASSGT